MPEELKPDPKQAVGQEAQLAAENMAAGTEKMPEVDVDADYEASKEYSVSDVDKSGAGAAAAAAATAPQREIPEPTDMRDSPDTTGNPDDYREMAKEVNPRANE
jgi:hypothetical protein